VISVSGGVIADQHTVPPSLDLDDTRTCPALPGCESCDAVDDLDVVTADLPVGVACLTLCGSCADAGDLPRFRSWSAAISRVLDHCGHLGVDADQAAAARSICG